MPTFCHGPLNDIRPDWDPGKRNRIDQFFGAEPSYLRHQSHGVQPRRKAAKAVRPITANPAATGTVAANATTS